MSPTTRAALALLLAAACSSSPVAAPPDAGPADAGQDAGADAGSDAGADAGHDAGHDAGADAGSDAGADAGPDAGSDAGTDAGPDAGPDGGSNTPDGPVTTALAHWRLTFADEFKGKTGAPSDAWCYDQLPAQCTIWAGANTNNCDLSDVNGAGPVPPIKANLAAALSLFDTSRDWNAASEADVRAAYAVLLSNRLKDLDKCTWSVYQMVNWMATDYASNPSWSARFDPSRVTVDPSGKGYLQLSAAYAPVKNDCIYGGSLGGPNCMRYGFAAGVLKTNVAYRVDPDPRWPGVYYTSVGGGCPSGGTISGGNCLVVSFAPPAFVEHFLDEHGPAYWVDSNPSYPGVYYANTPYRCRDNIDYAPTFGFRNLTCPILDGAVMSMSAANRAVDGQGVQRPRGFTQRFGRFEVKARIPKGLGAFPAAWLLPTEGGWPYLGGEIDILEARDGANEAYQTYHHGKCYDPGTGAEKNYLGPAECEAAGYASVHLDKGYTAYDKSPRVPGEFWKRDHVYSVEWTDQHIVYYVNDVRLGSIDLGTKADLYPTSAPGTLAYYEASNFPSKPMYWILNHSTYVAPQSQASWPAQNFLIDYVRTYAQCTRTAEFCPCGGAFLEGIGCKLGAGEALHCPVGVAPPAVSGGVTVAACAPANVACPNGGAKAGTRCLAKDLTSKSLVYTVHYWADADPRWPGVYYAPTNGACPSGGTFTGVNCQVDGYPGDVLETGVEYIVDTAASPVGIYYTPDYRQ